MYSAQIMIMTPNIMKHQTLTNIQYMKLDTCTGMRYLYMWYLIHVHVNEARYMYMYEVHCIIVHVIPHTCT